MRDLVIPTRQVQQSPGQAGRTREIPPTVEVIIPEGNIPESKNAPRALKNRMVILTLKGPRPSIEIDLVMEIDSEAAKRRELVDEDDLVVPWTCEDVDPFTPRIRNFKSSRKTRMPNNVKTYDGTGDPEDHLKIFQAAAQVERWAMATWCHMFNSTLIGVARQKKYVKDPVEIYNIKQRDEETIEDFMERFKVKTGRMKGAPKCMWISGFMHGVNNPELIKRLNEQVPKTMEEMMTVTTAFIRGETATASKKKGHLPWKSQDQPKQHASERKSDFRGQSRKGRGSSRFTPLARTPKEILAAEAGKFKPPPPMVTQVEKRSSNKFYDFHNDKGHSTDECMQLKKQIEELVQAGKLPHLIKEIKQGQDQMKNGKKEAPTKDKSLEIYMIQPWQRITKQKLTQSFARVSKITFLPLASSDGTEGPLIIEAEIGGHMIHRIYIDGGSSMEVLYEHCFNQLRPEIKSQMVLATTSLTGFSRETIWPLGQLRLLITIGDADHSHGMLKFPVDGGIVTIRGTILIPAECATVITSSKEIPKEARVRHENFKVAIHLNFPDQEVAIGGTLSAYGQTGLCTLLKENLDIFAWQSSDMTGVPRSVAEHRLNIREGYSPVRQKKRGQAPDRAKAIQAEVQKLVGAGIMREVYYHDWLSNPVMVKKHDGSWRMCVDFTDLNKACPQDCYPLPEIDWKVESLCGYPFKCFLDAYKGYHQIQMAELDEEKTAFHTSQGVYCYTKMPFGLKNAGATYQRLVDKAFDSQVGRNIEVYVDDLVIKSYTEAEMLRDIEETFRTLRKINMKLNPKKCTFGAVEGMFLGYTITPEGIKPCPDKTEAVLQLPSPRTIKEVQSLNGKLASLNRFLSKSAEKSLPLFKTLKKCIKKSDFHWTSEAEQAFMQLKQHLSELPLLVAPKPKEELIIYLSASYGAVSAVLMTERGTVQTPVYFISRALQGPELNYTPMEKLVLSLVFAAKRLRRTSVKGQILADFLVEKPDENPPDTPVVETPPEPWTLFTDGSSCVDGSGAGLILTSPEGTEFTYALRFQFTASNNEAEYEALIAGLRIAAQMGVRNVQVSVDSKLVANQVLGTYVAKEENMVKYLEKVKSLVSGFAKFSISQVPRSKNKKADALSKIASTSFAHISKQVLVEILKEKSIQEEEVATVIEEEKTTWMTPITEYLKDGTLPGERKEASKLRIKARQYELLEGVLYKRSFLKPWLRCVGPLQAKYVIREIHEGSCSMHAGPWSVVAKAMRLGYYWPTMHRDAWEMIQEVISVEIKMPTYRTAAVDVVHNDEDLRLNLDLLVEKRERAAICKAKAKRKMTKSYNARVCGVTFILEDFVYCSNDASHAVAEGNLAQNGKDLIRLQKHLEMEHTN
ncbi:reverse transcriptase domain-containing protein [Tanacetum coccineum]